MRHTTVVLAGLVVVGVVLVGYGFSQPEFRGGVVVEGVDEASIDESETVVACENLSTAQQRVFGRARTGDGTATDDSPDWEAEAVRDDGQYYRITVWGGENGRRILAIAAGLAVLGVGVVGGGLERLRRR